MMPLLGDIMKVIDIRQRSPEWHQWRNSGVSASEADIVLGISPYATPYRLYAEKKGILIPENLDRNPHVQRGVRIEPIARRAFEQRHNKDFILPLCGQSEDYPFLRASFDGVDDDGIPSEFKAPTEENFNDAKQNGIRSTIYQRYYPQVQHQICVAGVDRGWLTFHYKDQFIDFLVMRDEPFIKRLVLAAHDFAILLRTNTPPLKDPQRDLYLPEGDELASWENLALSCHVLQRQIDESKALIAKLSEEQAPLKAQLMAMMGDYAEAETAGIKLTLYAQKGGIDYKRALELMCPNLDPDDLESFRRPSSSRSRMTIKDESKVRVPFNMDQLIDSAKTDSFF
jgi:putative phage-type endonuclease